MAWELWIDNLYPEAEAYSGPAQQSTTVLEVSPEEYLSVGETIREDIADGNLQACEDNGMIALRVTVWADPAVIAGKARYCVVIQAHAPVIPAGLVPAGEFVSQFWPLIIAALVLILGIAVVVTYAITLVEDIDWQATGIPQMTSMAPLFLIMMPLMLLPMLMGD